MTKKIYILVIIKLDSDCCLSYDTFKYDTFEEAKAQGESFLNDWIEENCCEVDDEEQPIEEQFKITRYQNLAEVMDTFSAAEFDYSITEFEV